MSDQVITNILLSIASGAVIVGVRHIVRMSSRVNDIAVMLAQHGAVLERVEKRVEIHDLEISDLQKAK